MGPSTFFLKAKLSLIKHISVQCSYCFCYNIWLLRPAKYVQKCKVSNSMNLDCIQLKYEYSTYMTGLTIYYYKTPVIGQEEIGIKMSNDSLTL